MSRIFQSSLAFLVFGIVTSIGLNSQANDCSRIDELAKDILTKSRLLRGQVHHYRHTPEYQCLRDETQGLKRFAAHIRSLTRRTSNLHLIASDLRDLDACFQRLENAFDRVEINAAQGRGRIYGPTAHVKQLLLETEQCIRLMRREVRRLQRVLYRPQFGPYGSVDRFDHRYNHHPHTNQRYFDERIYNSRLPYSGRTDFRGNQGCRSTRDFGNQFRGYYGTQGGVGIDRNGITFGRGNLNFRVNF